MDYALQLRQVTKTYEKSAFVLDNVSFSLPSGYIMGFVGENGAGKTTTIGCILHTLFPDSGSIQVLGKEMQEEDVALRENIGVVYDGDNFPGYLTAEQLDCMMQGIYRQWDTALYQHYLKKFQLNKKQKISKYSKGMTMKLAISVALSHHPKLLILDEATNGLDPVTRDEILDIFLDFVGQDDHSIFLSSHILSDLEKIADYITFIQHGKIILTESKDNLLYRYAILRCKEHQFASLAAEDILAYRCQNYQIDVLVSDKKMAERKYPNILMDQGSIEEIMLILMQGARQ